ncbi:MAG TPA: ATP-binding protein [Candidatus Aminicenantes bacterium]|nr:ATP-binding protein [Candidatus Aminicenantes bacterium]
MDAGSLRFRMTGLYVAAMALTFVLVGVAVYRLTGGAIRRDLDHLLVLRAEGIAASIDTFWTVEAEEALRAGRPLGTASKVGNADFARLARRWVEERAQDPVLLDIVVQIFGPEGRLVSATQTVAGATLLPFEDLRPDLGPEARFLNIVGNGAPGQEIRFRALSFPVSEAGRLAYVVRVLSPLATVEAPLRRLRLILLLALPVAVVLSAAAGAWLAGRALRPVDRMIDSAQAISAETLHRRLPAPRGRDELSRLAATFNGLLDRIETGFSFHRQFWEDVAHELKTPLAIMKGEIEVALRTGADAEGSRQALASNLEEAERLIRLIEKMLTLARLDRGGAPLETADLDLAGLALRAVEEFRTPAEGKGVRLLLDAPAAASVRGDEARLRGLFYILLDNAVKFTPAGGTVAVEVAAAADGVRLTVSDTGPGIAEEDLGRVFDRFGRPGRPGEGGGFGLGLSIAKAVAESHGGRIEVRSRVGRGSAFTAVLPGGRT